jgi:allophanate hydrolase subunit 2
MGLRLAGPSLAIDPSVIADRLSSPVAPGAIQIAGGSLIILGVACGTMGGYPHVAHVISADLGRIGQLRPGDRVRFLKVVPREARRLDTESRRASRMLMTRVSTIAGDPIEARVGIEADSGSEQTIGRIGLSLTDEPTKKVE